MNGKGRLLKACETGCAGETHELGRWLAALLLPGDVVLLAGGLGAGKTCFARGVAQGLGVTDNVTSPTFVLMREYAGRIPLFHLDAYRLEDSADLFGLGIDEYLEGEGVLLVEWGDRMRDFFAPEHLEVVFDLGEGEEDRRISFVSQGASWRRRIAEGRGGGGREGHG